MPGGRDLLCHATQASSCCYPPTTAERSPGAIAATGTQDQQDRAPSHHSALLHGPPMQQHVHTNCNSCLLLLCRVPSAAWVALSPRPPTTPATDKKQQSSGLHQRPACQKSGWCGWQWHSVSSVHTHSIGSGIQAGPLTMVRRSAGQHIRKKGP